MVKGRIYIMGHDTVRFWNTTEIVTERLRCQSNQLEARLQGTKFRVFTKTANKFPNKSKFHKRCQHACPLLQFLDPYGDDYAYFRPIIFIYEENFTAHWRLHKCLLDLSTPYMRLRSKRLRLWQGKQLYLISFLGSISRRQQTAKCQPYAKIWCKITVRSLVWSYLGNKVLWFEINHYLLLTESACWV